MLNSTEIKKIVLRLGADLCGIASIDRFADAPEGYHPLDVFPQCRSVISFGCRFPVSTLLCDSHSPYTLARNNLVSKTDMISLNLCQEMERLGLLCVPIPSKDNEWDAKTGRWRSVISQKHAAQAAGLGTIGRHSLLITPEFGSMIWLGAVLCSAELVPDPLKEPLCRSCGSCAEACPAGALNGHLLDQQACKNHAFKQDPEKHTQYISCHKCRDACPFLLGSKNSFPK